MHHLEHSPAELLSDEAIYRRTVRGQRELLRLGDAQGSTATRMLARVNGYTDLRRLIDLAPDEAGAIGKAILKLMERELIELVEHDD